MVTITLTDNEWCTAINALRLAAQQCIADAQQPGALAGSGAVATALRQSAAQYTALADKFDNVE